MLAPWKKSYDQPRRHIKKQRHYFADKSPFSQSYGFSLVMYGCESWTIKKAESWRNDAFQLRYWRRLLRVPWTARRSNQSILKEISPEYSLEGLMLKLKLQYFGHLMQRADSFEETLVLGKIEGRRRRGWQRMRWLDSIINSMNMNLSKLWWLSWLRIHLQCRRPGFDPWVGKIPWRRERLTTPVCWPGEFHGLYSPKESDTTESLSLYVYYRF